MRRALALAVLGPAAGPNPRVGCVLLDRCGTVVGEGWHRGAGTPHAEVDALTRALTGAAAPHPAGAGRPVTAVVTLEPCNHTGRTGPCARALAQAGIRRVIHASADPNPKAAGGAQTLRAAGVDVEGGVLAAKADEINRHWLASMTLGRPYVTWKHATTLDGRSAAAGASSRWITGEQARADVHRRRAQSDAVVVGTGTILADDPQLTVRDATGTPAGRQPLRVVVGRRGLPPGARVLDDAARTLHLRTRDPGEVVATLGRLEVRHVWLEGGPTLAAAFLRARLVDEVLSYVAPALLGAGAHTVGDLGVTTIADAVRLRLRAVEQLGEDVLLISAPPEKEG